MKINFYDDDPRFCTDPDYQLKMGSFGTVAYFMNNAFKKLDCYAKPDDADWVGKCGSLDPQFRYKNKKAFYINVWETNNSLPDYLLEKAKQSTNIFGLCNKTTNMWKKYGFNIDTIYGGCDTDFWHQTKEKNKNQFIFCHVNHATVRSGLYITIPAFSLKFKNNPDVKLIIKDSGEHNIKLENFIKSFDCNNIEYINDFWTSVQIRDLYSESHACINLLRSTSFGLPLLESSACDTLCICGDVSPTDELVDKSFAKMIPHNGEINIYPYVDRISNSIGLKNYYGNFNYQEIPKFWDFNIETVADHLWEVYNNWNTYEKIDKITPIKNRWQWDFSAMKLIKILSQS